jgi:hypothetical protein
MHWVLFSPQPQDLGRSWGARFAEMWKTRSGARILDDRAWLEVNLEALTDAFLSTRSRNARSTSDD